MIARPNILCGTKIGGPARIGFPVVHSDSMLKARAMSMMTRVAPDRASALLRVSPDRVMRMKPVPDAHISRA